MRSAALSTLRRDLPGGQQTVCTRRAGDLLPARDADYGANLGITIIVTRREPNRFDGTLCAKHIRPGSMCHGMSPLRDDGGKRRGDEVWDAAGDTGCAVSPRPGEPSVVAPWPSSGVAGRMPGQVDPIVRLVRRVVGCIDICRSTTGRVVRRNFGCRVGLRQQAMARCRERVQHQPNWPKASRACTSMCAVRPGPSRHGACSGCRRSAPGIRTAGRS